MEAVAAVSVWFSPDACDFICEAIVRLACELFLTPLLSLTPPMPLAYVGGRLLCLAVLIPLY